MKHILRTEKVELTLEMQIFESDLAYPTNTRMDVTVSSSGFSGTARMDIDAKQLGRFAQDMVTLYRTLDGEAKIQEPYGYQMFLRFSGNGRRQIFAEGFLKSDYEGNTQELKFETCFDQTYLGAFSQELVDSYGKYRLS